MMQLIHPANKFDLLVLHIPVLSYIKPNQHQNASPWAWHCLTPGLVFSSSLKHWDRNRKGWVYLLQIASHKKASQCLVVTDTQTASPAVIDTDYPPSLCLQNTSKAFCQCLCYTWCQFYRCMQWYTSHKENIRLFVPFSASLKRIYVYQELKSFNIL